MILKESWVFSDRFININSDVVLLHLDLHVRQRMAATFRGTIHLNQFYLTLSLSAVHAKYTPGSQQCRSTLQIRTSCAGVLHCRSLPTYFKLLYLLNHSSSLIHPYINLKDKSKVWVIFDTISIKVHWEQWCRWNCDLRVINAWKQAFSVVPKVSPWCWKSCAHMRTTSLWGVASKWLVTTE